MSNKMTYEFCDLPPEFHEAADYLMKKGFPCDWVLRTVDAESPTAVFLKDGKPWYRSDCPNYEGYWLDGAIGAVQCQAAGQRIPDLFWYFYCSKDCCQCFYHKPNATHGCK